MSFLNEMIIRSQDTNFETAIDASIIRERFQRELKKTRGNQTSISDLYVTRVFPRKDGGLTIQYHLNLERPGSSGVKKLILCGHLLGPGQSWPDYIDDSGDDCFVLDDIRLTVPVFPFDPRLEHLIDLTSIHQGFRISKLPETALGMDFEIVDYELLGYRLEKRCVLRYTLKSKSEPPARRKIVAKVFRRSGFKRSMKISKMLDKGGYAPDSIDRLTIPRILRSDEEFTTVFMEDAPGISLHFLIDKAILAKACSAAGRALRKLHELDTSELKTYTVSDELGNLERFHELTMDMYPEFGDSLKSELDVLSGIIPSEPVETAFSHRDFFDKQLLYSDSRFTLLDYDNAAAADPALDVGNFVAHLVLRKIQHSDLLANIDCGIESFLETYGGRDREFQSRVVWWTRASLLRLFALYMLRPRWRDFAPGLLFQSVNLSNKQFFGGANGI